MNRRITISLGLTLILLTACSGQALPPAPEPQTALAKSLEFIDKLQSFTVTSKSTIKGDKETNSSTTITLVDQAGQTSLRENQSTYQFNPKSTRLCIKSACYQSDDTGLLKPVSGEYQPILPTLESMGLTGVDILKAAPTFAGEEELNGEKVFKYQISATQEMMQSKLDSLNGAQTTFTYSFPEPLPRITLYVNAKNGYLLRKVEVFNQQLSYELMGKKTVNQTFYETAADYSAWNETKFTLPEFVPADNQDWQKYSGKFTDKVSFEFPKVYSLNEWLGYPSLKTPSGSQMDFQIFDATIAAITPVENSTLESRKNLCDASAKTWLKNRISGFKTVEKTEWIETARFSFCKVWISKDNGSEVNYLFNEPIEIAGANKRLLPTTFHIIIKPFGSEDAGSLFWDVIQTIKLPTMK